MNPLEAGEAMNATDGDDLARVEFEDKGEYLYASFSGEEDTLRISEYCWRQAIEECNRRGATKLLIVEDFPNQLPMMDIFALIIAITEMLENPLKIAFVDRDLEQAELNKFGETVAINRGVHGRVFMDIASAEAWLIS